MRPQSALLNSCVNRSGARLTSSAPTSWAKPATRRAGVCHRHDDMKALRAGRLIQEASLSSFSSRAGRSRPPAPTPGCLSTIQIEDAEVRVGQSRHARGETCCVIVF
jgi:hypothetical protein